MQIFLLNSVETGKLPFGRKTPSVKLEVYGKDGKK